MKMKKMWRALLVPVLVLLSVNAFAGKFTLSSRSFSNNGKIPLKYVKGANGQNISPQLQWSNAPNGTGSFVITCIDKNPVAQDWVHWMVINIPSQVTNLSQGSSKSNMPVGSRELNNGFGNKGYGGPQPPPSTGVHKYVFTIYAIKPARIKIGRNKYSLTERELLKLLRGKILAKATYTGTFSNK